MAGRAGHWYNGGISPAKPNGSACPSFSFGVEANRWALSGLRVMLGGQANDPAAQRMLERLRHAIGSCGRHIGQYPQRGLSAMSALQGVEKLLAGMTRAEKAQLLQWVVRDLGDAFPGIASTLGVSGGEPCIVRTRIPVWGLEQARRLGTSEAELLQCYPTLRAEDPANAWAYVRSHRAEIDRQIQENETA
jgi:uncharacterized protein (DUF433 family)